VWARGYDGAGDAGRGCRELCWVNCSVAGPAIAGRCAAACSILGSGARWDHHQHLA
jgi:hypothetical protein